MLKRIATFAVVFSFATFAQNPPAPPVDLVKSYLSLTDQQVSQLQQIQQAERTANQTLAQSIQQKQQQLETALSSGSTDAAALGRLLLDIQNLRKQMDANHTTYHNQALNVLNATQKTKAQGLEDAAKLAPTIAQAAALGIVLPPAPPAGGPQMGFRGGPGPGAFRGGPGPGPRPMRMRPPVPEQ